MRDKKGSSRIFSGLIMFFLTAVIWGAFCASAEASLPDKLTVYIGSTWKSDEQIEGAKWTSSDKTVAKAARKTGVISGIKKGKCTVTVRFADGEKHKIRVTVKNNRRPKGFLLMGHRGDTDKYPENTMIAFKSALRRGCDGVELDVFYTDSGDFMIFHDEDLLRMCRKNVDILDVSKANRNKYPITGSAYARSHRVLIPTLDEALKLMRKKNATVFIHLKNAWEYDAEIAGKLADLIRSYNMEDKSVVFTGSHKCLRLFKESGLHLGYSTSETDKEVLMENIFGCTGCGLEYVFLINPEQAQKEIVDLIHKSGMLVGVYKVKTRKQLQQLYNVQADFAMLYHVNIVQ